MSELVFEKLVDRTNGADETLRIRFVGTASFVVENDDRCIVLDPFVTRPGVLRLARPLKSNKKLINEKFPRADDILIGHSHYDHLMDAPHLCLSGPNRRIIGGKSTALIASALGVPDDSIVTVNGHERVACGQALVRSIPSLHAPVIGNRILFDGVVSEKPRTPLFVWDYKKGEVFDWQIQIGGKQVVHIGSADLIDEEIEKISAVPTDVVCLCAANRKHRNEEYIRAVVDHLQPKFIVPCHWDRITNPWGTGSRRPALFRKAYLADLVCRLSNEKNVEVVLLDFDGILKL